MPVRDIDPTNIRLLSSLPVYIESKVCDSLADRKLSPIILQSHLNRSEKRWNEIEERKERKEKGKELHYDFILYCVLGLSIGDWGFVISSFLGLIIVIKIKKRILLYKSSFVMGTHTQARTSVNSYPFRSLLQNKDLNTKIPSKTSKY